MNEAFEILGYEEIKRQLQELANSAQAKEMIKEMTPFCEEDTLRKNLRETTQARQLLDALGTPPVPSMEGVEENINRIERGELLLPEEIAAIGSFLISVRRLKEYLEKGKQYQIGIAYYCDNLVVLEELETEITRCIRYGRVDDYASNTLRDIRKNLLLLEEKVKEKAESIMKSQKSCMAENFIVTRSGRICVPVKKEHKGKIAGSVIDKSATGATLFIEPAAVARLSEEIENLKIAEDSEVRRILYTLMGMISDEEAVFRENIRMIIRLDYMFAKGKLSAGMEAIEPAVNTQGMIRIEQGRHPLLAKESCVPLDFAIGKETKGIIITGPNTGGKTVSIKTVGLFSLMSCSGLHIPCKSADIAMQNQVLCDIGDGQNITDNLSTFSAHIQNVIHILRRVTKESLVILDELGSGTDPTEGMGIAIAILEELRRSGCLFLVTTHYPEVKTYAARHTGIKNARMAFDRENLKPLYQLEIGKSGDSCALYIAKRLGLPGNMLLTAAREAYGEEAEAVVQELHLEEDARKTCNLEKEAVSRLKKHAAVTNPVLSKNIPEFHRGDSVIILPEKKTAIVVKPADAQGNVLVQLQKEKQLVNHKRIKLQVAAAELYPEDYDFSIIFDSVAVRKARHHMNRGKDVGMAIDVEE